MAFDALERPTEGPSLDRLCGVLADERRRDVLYYLMEGPDDAADVETLAEHLAETHERDAPAAADRRERSIATELSHVHLPKLDAADIVEYAHGSGAVEYVGHETAEALLDATPAEN